MSTTSQFSRFNASEQDKKQSEEIINYLNKKDKKFQLSIKGGTKKITLTPKIVKLFMEVLAHMAQDEEVSVFSSKSEITTQQAADLLNVSRPFLIKLLDSGEIPSFKVGKHRRVLAEDVEKYKQKSHKLQREALKKLAALAQKYDMGY